jgi:signal transduction histidine kinase
MISFEICLLSGFFINFQQGTTVGIFWLVVSCITYIPVMLLPWIKECSVTSSTEIINRRYDSYDSTFNALSETSDAFSLWISILLPCFSINYLLALSDAYGLEETIIVYQLLNVVLKAIFALVTADREVEMIEKLKNSKKEFEVINNDRRAFLNYIFHEMRNPLNIMGLAIHSLKLNSATKQGF